MGSCYGVGVGDLMFTMFIVWFSIWLPVFGLLRLVVCSVCFAAAALVDLMVVCYACWFASALHTFE